MPIVSHTHPFVVGVDTHAKKHALCLVSASTGEVVDQDFFPTTSKGLKRAVAWVAKRTGGDLATLWVIEGAASYGALLARTVTDAGYHTVEAARMDKRAHIAAGKTDLIDAHKIAVAVLPVDVSKLRQLRLDEGIRAGLQVLLAARERLTRTRTSQVNALIALLRTHDLGIDARRSPSQAALATIVAWRERSEDIGVKVARREAVYLAQGVLRLDKDLAANKTEITELVKASEAAELLDKVGYGPISTARVYVAYSHHGRIRSEAAFAALAGVNPIPASSGNTSRHRLNRHGDRQLNRALHNIAMSRKRWHPESVTYYERRISEGKTKREALRCLKRALARRTFKLLNKVTSNTPQDA